MPKRGTAVRKNITTGIPRCRLPMGTKTHFLFMHDALDCPATKEVNMPFTIEHIKDPDYLLATFTGPLTMGVVREYIDALLPILEETGCRRLLSDSTAAQIQITSKDIMHFPKMAETSPLTNALKRAALAPDDTSDYEMYETFSKIQGQEVQVFTDRTEALEWLLSDTE